MAIGNSTALPLSNQSSCLQLPTQVDWVTWVQKKINLQPTAAQVTALETLARGEDVLLLLPTGSGKSLVYLAWAAYAWQYYRQPTLVISPLIALMQDQLQAATCWLAQARALHSHLAEIDQYLLWGDFVQKKVPMLFCSPEKIISLTKSSQLPPLKLAALVIDEAHCLSQWGNDFRPSYRQLGRLRTDWLQHCPIVSMTASATEQTRLDMTQILKLKNLVVIEQTVYRSNLAIQVHCCSKWSARLDHLLQLLYSMQEKYGVNQKYIIYCTSRKKCEQVVSYLQQKNVNAACYHAGMSAKQRQRSYVAFSAKDCQVMVATCAFGMGIDIPNIRCVFHLQMPASMIAYYQELGRAGRDQQACEGHLWYSKIDFQMWLRRFHVSHSKVASRKLYSDQLQQLNAYLQNSSCRMIGLCQLFSPNQTLPTTNCMQCDNCQPKSLPSKEHGASDPSLLIQSGDLTALSAEEQQIVLELFHHLRKPLGLRNICQILKGSKAKRYVQAGLQQLPQWGALAHYALDVIARGIEQLLAAKSLVWKGKKYPTVWLANRPIRRSKTTTTKRSQSPPDPTMLLWQQLLRWRKKEAQQRGWKLYMVCHRTALQAIVEQLPTSQWQLSEIAGIGPSKLEKFGESLLAMIHTHLSTYNIDAN